MCVPFLLLACGALFPAEKVATTASKPDCAHICVYHCCRLYGVPVEMKAIMKEMPPRERGNSLLEIRETLDWIGLESEGRLVTFDELASGTFPVVAHYHDHFVVVEAADDKHVRILDGLGRRKILLAKHFRALWDRKVLVVRPPAKDAFLPAFVGPPPPETPRIAFKTLVIDAGEVENPNPGKSVDFTFELQNVGTAALEIKRIRTNCKCAVGDKPEAPVPPGGQGKIIVKYEPGTARGTFMYNAYVETNDPSFPVLPLTIAGNTSRTLKVAPRRLAFGEVVAGSRARACLSHLHGRRAATVGPRG